MIRTRDHHAVRAERAFPRPPGPSPAVLRPGLQGAPPTPRASDRLLSPMEPRAVSSLPPASFNRPHGCKLHIMWWHVAILHKHGSIFKKFLMTVDAHACSCEKWPRAIPCTPRQAAPGGDRHLAERSQEMATRLSAWTLATRSMSAATGSLGPVLSHARFPATTTPSPTPGSH